MPISQSFTQITEISDLTLFIEILQKEADNALVVFDVDYVLIMPTDEYAINRYPCRQQLWKDLQQRLPSTETQFLRSIIVSNTKWRLVDPKIIDIVAYLKKHSIPAIALTALSTGKFGIIEKREELRIHELKTNGINFAELSPFKEDLKIDTLKNKHGIPMLKNGIVLTAELDKALVLERILHSNKYYPKTILFIDDNLQNLKSVSSLCAKLQIAFHGFHYIAASSMLPTPVDGHIENLRFQVLEKWRLWLTDEDIIEMVS